MEDANDRRSGGRLNPANHAHPKRSTVEPEEAEGDRLSQLLNLRTWRREPAAPILTSHDRRMGAVAGAGDLGRSNAIRSQPWRRGNPHQGNSVLSNPLLQSSASSLHSNVGVFSVGLPPARTFVAIAPTLANSLDPSPSIQQSPKPPQTPILDTADVEAELSSDLFINAEATVIDKGYANSNLVSTQATGREGAAETAPEGGVKTRSPSTQSIPQPNQENSSYTLVTPPPTSESISSIRNRIAQLIRFPSSTPGAPVIPRSGLNPRASPWSNFGSPAQPTQPTSDATSSRALPSTPIRPSAQPATQNDEVKTPAQLITESKGPVPRSLRKNIQSRPTAVEFSLVPGAIIWMPKKKASIEPICCVREGHCNNDELNDEGYNHPGLILGTHSEGSGADNIRYCTIAQLRTYSTKSPAEYLELRTRGTGQQFVESFPIWHKDCADILDSLSPLKLVPDIGKLYSTTYVQLQHVFRVRADQVMVFHHGSIYASDVRLDESSYNRLMGIFGLIPQTYCVAEWKLSQLLPASDAPPMHGSFQSNTTKSATRREREKGRRDGTVPGANGWGWEETKREKNLKGEEQRGKGKRGRGRGGKRGGGGTGQEAGEGASEKGKRKEVESLGRDGWEIEGTWQ